jgi:hypothetical protein
LRHILLDEIVGAEGFRRIDQIGTWDEFIDFG